jgi:scyllo-inositol 2-dehydrogenase (NAD+)
MVNAPRPGGHPEPLRLGIAGTGFIGELHARNAAASAEIDLVAVVSARRGLDQLWEHDEVDAVLIATRTTDHVEHAIAAVNAGKHVLLEKPGATTLADQHRIAHAAAARPDLVVRVAYHRRHDPRYRELERLIAQGAIGEPIAVHSISRETYPPSDADAYSGGFIADVGVHDFDTARWLLGENPRTVFAQARANVYDVTPGDNVYVTIGYERAASTIQLSRTSPVGHDIRFEVVGTEGSAMVAPNHAANGIAIVNADRTHEYPDDCRAAFPDAYPAELADFAATCRGTHAPGATLDDDRWALATAIAAHASATHGRIIDLTGT